MNPSFSYLDHTSELKVRAVGNTKEDVFTQICLGLFNSITPIDKVEPITMHSISVTAPNLKTLLFDFVDELIFLQDTESTIISKVQELTITQDKETYTLHAQLAGDSASNYPCTGEIKAPTYNDMIIEAQSEGWIGEIVVDVWVQDY